MGSNIFISFIFSIGASAWVYNKFQNSNGGLTQRSLVGAGAAFIFAFIVFLSVISFVTNMVST